MSSSVSVELGDHINMSISGDSLLDETLNWGLWRFSCSDSIKLCVCVPVNKILAKGTHQYWRGFLYMVAYQTCLNPIKRRGPETKITVTPFPILTPVGAVRRPSSGVLPYQTQMWKFSFPHNLKIMWKINFQLGIMVIHLDRNLRMYFTVILTKVKGQISRSKWK